MNFGITNTNISIAQLGKLEAEMTQPINFGDKNDSEPEQPVQSN